MPFDARRTAAPAPAPAARAGRACAAAAGFFAGAAALLAVFVFFPDRFVAPRQEAPVARGPALAPLAPFPAAEPALMSQPESVAAPTAAPPAALHAPPRSFSDGPAASWSPAGTVELTGVGRCAVNDHPDSWLPGLQRNAASMKEDDARFPRVLTDAARAQTLGACGAGLVNVSLAAQPSLYGDWRDCMAVARAVPDARYCERTIFHSFWASLPTRDQTAWFIISFLATQDLEYTELWMWSPPGDDVAHDALMAPFAALPKLVHFKPWSAAAEGARTPLAARPDVIAAAHDAKYWLETDLLRALAPGVHGGVYVDVDVLLLRNLGPLLGDEWLYQWGTDCSMTNGAVLRLKAGSPLSSRLLDAIIATPAQPASTEWGRGAYAKSGPFTRYPACFFNGAWMTNDGEERSGFNDAPHTSRWAGSFAYHLHGGVFKFGAGAAPNSEYVTAKRELWALFRARFPAVARALLEAGLLPLVPPLEA